MKRIALLMTFALALSSCQFVTINPNMISQSAIRCGGEVETRSFDLSGFQSIRVYGRAEVKLAQGDSYSVSVSANEEVFQYLDYEVVDGVLNIQNKDRVQFRSETHYVVYVQAPVLTQVKVNGAGDLNLMGYHSDTPFDIQVNGAGDIDLTAVQVPSLQIEVNGAGDIEAESLDVEELSVEVNGAGDAKLSGRATNAKFKIAGAGDIDARGLQTEHVDVNKAGAGRVRY